MMGIDEAKELLRFDTQEDAGAFTRLRLGQDPGSEARSGLLDALRTIQRADAEMSCVSRSIAVSCGIILHFATECNRNLNSSGASHDALESVAGMSQGAFKVLMGDR